MLYDINLSHNDYKETPQPHPQLCWLLDVIFCSNTIQVSIYLKAFYKITYIVGIYNVHCIKCEYRYALPNDISVNDGPHTHTTVVP